MRARWLVAGGGLVYLAGVVLLALAVHVELPGPLAAYGDPSAWWPVAVQVVAGVVSFGTWRWVHRRSSRPFAVVLLGLGVATVLVLATASYARCPDPGLSTGWSVVTRVVGLITNNYAVDMFTGCTPEGVAPLALQYARLAQLVVVLVAFTSALTALLRTQVDRIAVRSARRVSLVLGADASSAALLPALAQDSERLSLAVVTADPASPWVGQARAAGWRVVVADPHGDGALRRLLQRPGGRHALRRLAVLAADSTEAQRLVRAVQDAVEGRRALSGDGPVRALVRIDEPWQAEDWRRRYLARVPEWIVDTVSENEVTARLLVDDLVARGAARVLLVGRSDLTFAVLGELAQHARERALSGEDAPLPPVTVLGPDAEEVLTEHALAQHRFGNAHLDGITADTTTPLATLVAAAEPVTALVFSGEVDAADQRLAARLGATYPALLVHSRHSEVTGLGAEPLLAQVRAFGTTLDAGEGRPVDSWERIARLAHEDYVRRYPDPTRASRRPWAELEPFYRESNVRLVLTTLRSAVAVGRSWGASTETATAPSPEQLDRMAEREHESWRRHHQRAGRPHHDAVAWAELSEESRAKTRGSVTDSLALLETLGYRSFDDPYATWVRLRRRGQVSAVRRTEPWTWRTSTGEVMRGAAGDWEVTDDDGTSRSVAASIFERTHTHLDGDRWERTGEIRGRRARPGEVVHSLEGDATAREGQWVLQGVAGEEWLVPSAHLERSYERVEDAS